MPANSRKPKQFSVGVYDRQHLRNLSARLRKVQALIDEAAAQATRIAVRTGYTDTTKDFRFDDFPQARREIDLLIGELASSLTSNMREASSDAWGVANAKNDAMVDFMLASSGVEMSRKATRPWYNKNTRALNAFLHRQEEGMELSRNVWRLDDFKTELELALEMGLGRGKAAAELSRDVRSYLKHPDKLFRRVRDERGNLRLSRAAAAFHPGQGVYRSSYKNALRLTATETNMAYRMADNRRWQQIGFVLGQHIQPSPTNHPVVDICDELQGDYPKDFIFVGWHPFCKCFAVPKLPSIEQFTKYQQAILDGEDVSEWQWGSDEVEEMPDTFTQWAKENAGRVESARKLPYFIKDNYSRFKWESYDESWQQTYFDNDSLGYVATQGDRIAQGHRNKQELAKFRKEQAMCRVLASHGKRVEHLAETPGISSSDITVNGIPADLKRTASHVNILKYARHATNSQGAKMVVYQFDKETREIYLELEKLKKRGIRFLYFFTGREDTLY